MHISSNLDGLNTLYCVLWYPVLTHERIEPLYISEKIAFTKTKAKIEGDEQKVYKYPASIIYKQSIEKDVDGKDCLFDDLDLDIEIKNILVSDDADNEAFIDLLLLEEGFTISPNGARIGIPKERFKANNQNKRLEQNTPLRDICITVKYTDGEKQCTDTLLLECIDARNNGLFSYKYQYLTDEEREENKLSKRYLLNQNYKITNALYHSLKSFYHSHRYHDSDKDGMLCPCCIDKAVCLTEPNNKALLHYLSEFETIFREELNFIKESREIHTQKCLESLKELIRLRDAESNIIERLNEKESLKKKSKKDVNDIESLRTEALDINQKIKECRKLVNRSMDGDSKYLFNASIRSLNIYLYYQTLFHSKYNRQFKLTPEELVSFKIKKNIKNINIHDVKLSYLTDSSQIAYKKAINIHNYIEALRLLLSQIENDIDEYSRFQKHYRLTELANQNKQLERLSQESSKLATRQWKYGLLIGGIGVIIGLTPGLISNLSTYNPTKESYKKFEKEQSYIKEKLDSLNNEGVKYIVTLNDSIKVLNNKLIQLSTHPSPAKAKNSTGK